MATIPAGTRFIGRRHGCPARGALADQAGGGPRAGAHDSGRAPARHATARARSLAIPPRGRAHDGRTHGVGARPGGCVSVDDIRPAAVPLHQALGHPPGRVHRGSPARAGHRGALRPARSLRRRRDSPGHPVRRPACERPVPGDRGGHRRPQGISARYGGGHPTDRHRADLDLRPHRRLPVHPGLRIRRVQGHRRVRRADDLAGLGGIW